MRGRHRGIFVQKPDVDNGRESRRVGKLGPDPSPVRLVPTCLLACTIER
jgi:hypothetical protein